MQFAYSEMKFHYEHHLMFHSAHIFNNISNNIKLVYRWYLHLHHHSPCSDGLLFMLLGYCNKGLKSFVQYASSMVHSCYHGNHHGNNKDN